MRAALAAVLLMSICSGPEGPELPPDVGTNHPSSATSGSSERPRRIEPVTSTEPREVGERVFASFHDTGLYFHAVVVERDEARHRVVYADGTNEWVEATQMLPDALAAEARIHVRERFDGEFTAAEVGRRLGDVLYVQHASGEEGWVALPHVRLSPTDPGFPSPDAEPYIAPEGRVGSVQLVDYHQEGLRFAGVVTAEREDGALHVVYLDSEREWTSSSLAQPEALTRGDVVHVRRSWDPPEWVRGRIARRVGFAFQVELDDGGLAWTSLFRLRVPTDAMRALEPPPSERTIGDADAAAADEG